jgi:hypothetical protein
MFHQPVDPVLTFRRDVSFDTAEKGLGVLPVDSLADWLSRADGFQGL